MKTKLISIITLSLLSVGAFAQTSVEKSATAVDFTVGISNGVAVSSYTWAASGAAITNPAVVNANTDNTVSVVFDGAIGNLGALSVYATSTTTCKGSNSTANYVIVAPGDLPLKATVAAVSADVCPITDNNLAATGAGDIGYTINFFANDGLTPAPVVSFIYQINSDGAVTVDDVASATSYTLNLDTNYDNTQTGAKVIRILKITQSATVGALYTTTTAPTATVNVNLAPIVDGL